MDAYPPDIALTEILRELAEHRAKIAKLENAHGTRPDPESNALAVTDRRAMLKKVAGIAIGVATVGLLRPNTGRADNGDALSFGLTDIGAGGNSETAAARFVYNGAASNSALFVFEDGTQFTPSQSVFRAVLAGWATDVGPAGSNVGVYGFSSKTSGVGVLGNGENTGGVGGLFRGTRAALLLNAFNSVADPNSTNPTSGSVGDVYRGSTNGSLWYRTSSSLGSYRRLADDTTAGALTPFAASSRFVNLSVLNGGATATYQIGGVTVTGNTVPASARAIIARIADANPTGGGGNLLVGATNPPAGGVIAVVAGAPQNSFFFSALDATGKLYVKNTSPSGSVQIIIDIAGYFE
jgi:hypothetical protein